MSFTRINQRWILSSVVLLSLAACSFRPSIPNQVVYLLPEGFQDAVVIIYEQVDGVAPQHDTETGKLLIRIPRDGVLRLTTNAKDTDGPPSFFYELADGRRIPIELLVSFDPTGKYRNSKQV